MSRTTFVAIAMAAVLSITAWAQAPGLPQAKAPAASPAPTDVVQDALGRSTPSGAVLGFIRAADRGDFVRAADYLDTTLAGESRQELARTLAQLINSASQINLDAISKDPNGRLDDGLRRTRERVGELKAGDERLDLMLDRVERGSDPPTWLFSAETLQGLPEFARQREEAAAHWLERVLPRQLSENRIGGIELYRWIFFPLSLLLIVGIAWLATKTLEPLVLRALHPAYREVSLAAPIRLLFFGGLVSIGGRFGVTLMARYFWNRVATILIVIATAWLLLRVVNVVAVRFKARLRRSGAEHQIAAVQLFRGVAAAFVSIAGLLIALSLLGVDLTAVVTGLGIGGVALAFAAQKTIENLFGTVMLVTDQPVRVGDFCRIGDYLGTIEDIGLRSTRVRTLDRTVVSVPNGQVASMVLENFARRDKVWFKHVIGLRYETNAGQLRRVLEDVRVLLQEDPRVESETARVRFVKFGGSSLDLEIFAYVLARDYAVFLGIQEDLLLRIMDIVEASGTSVAFPSQTTYLAQDRGLPPRARAAAEAGDGLKEATKDPPPGSVR